MTQISATILADSVAQETGDRITTFLLTYPRFIHAELMTHRVFSRNTASSRAIPITRMMEAVRARPAEPVRWGMNQRGMQADQLLPLVDAGLARSRWHNAAACAVEYAALLAATGVHKQIANRVLEPFSWTTTLVTATEWLNFFQLRCHKDAQPEFQALADRMLEAYVTNTPREVVSNVWHLPFNDPERDRDLNEDTRLRVNVARCARTSYTRHEAAFSVEEDCALADRLLFGGHWSPFEHVAYARRGQHANFKGWRAWRADVDVANAGTGLHRSLERSRLRALAVDRGLVDA